jgi:hypothetical protein
MATQKMSRAEIARKRNARIRRKMANQYKPGDDAGGAAKAAASAAKKALKNMAKSTRQKSRKAKAKKKL